MNLFYWDLNMSQFKYTSVNLLHISYLLNATVKTFKLYSGSALFRTPEVDSTLKRRLRE